MAKTNYVQKASIKDVKTDAKCRVSEYYQNFGIRTDILTDETMDALVEFHEILGILKTN